MDGYRLPRRGTPRRTALSLYCICICIVGGSRRGVLVLLLLLLSSSRPLGVHPTFTAVGSGRLIYLPTQVRLSPLRLSTFYEETGPLPL